MYFWLAAVLGSVLRMCAECRGAEIHMKGLETNDVTTQYGKVKGIVSEFTDSTLAPVTFYHGLPYASIKEGKLRFMPPTSPQNEWRKLSYIRGTHGPACPQNRFTQREIYERYQDKRAQHFINVMQYTKKQSENCLYLNVYRPTAARPTEQNDSAALPVMVFIHGESFDMGTGNAYDGSVLASYGRVIVITLNYRLGVLGFMSTGGNVGSDNYALLDIAAALLWIKQNVANFGGDPGRVTLFGHSYGAALVNLLLVSPIARDGKLFQRGILMSGSALSPWAISRNPISCTSQLAERLNCSAYLADSRALINCFRNTSIDDIIKNAPSAPKYFTCFGPSVSSKSSVLPRAIETLLKSPNTLFATSELMFGTTKNEAFDFLTPKEAEYGISELRKSQIIRTYIHNTMTYHKQRIYDVIDHNYKVYHKKFDDRTRRNSVLEFLSDGLYIVPLMKLAKYHNQHGSLTYQYVFSYAGKQETRQRWKGSVHGDELAYVFGAPLVDGLRPFARSKSNNDTEIIISKAMMTYWSNFAKTGNPNKPIRRGKIRNRFDNLVWANSRKIKRDYLEISRPPKMRMNYRSQYVHLWLDLIPKHYFSSKNSDPADHLLNNSHNLSTFDAPDSLQPIPGVFPVPERPTTTTTSPITITNIENYLSTGDEQSLHANNEATIFGEHDRNQTAIGDVHFGDNRVQISITAAVGVTLLFLNILIFAGIYHQRERIRKLRRPNPNTGNRARENGNHIVDREIDPKSSSLYENESLLPTNEETLQVQVKPSDHRSNPSSYNYTSTSMYVPMHKLPSSSGRSNAPFPVANPRVPSTYRNTPQNNTSSTLPNRHQNKGEPQCNNSSRNSNTLNSQNPQTQSAVTFV